MRVGIYLRVSTREQAQNGNSIPEQKERLTKYCEAHGWTISDYFIDAGLSGSNTDRPELQRLIDAAKAHTIDAVLVYKLDRLSRSQKDTLNLIENVFLPNKVDFISLSENFDTSTAFGRAMIGMLAVFAQLEREQITERMTIGREARAKKGLFHGGPRGPFGYDYNDGHLTPNADAAIVKRIFDLAAAGNGPTHIATVLNENGISIFGKEWDHRGVRYLLQNRSYLGEITFNDVVCEQSHEPLVDAETFDLVQTLTASRRENSAYPMRPGKATAYLTGLLYCGRCGRRYYRNSVQTRTTGGVPVSRPWYSCSARINGAKCKNKNYRMDDLDNLVFDQIRALKLDAGEPSAPVYDPLPQLRADLDKTSAQLSRLLDLYSVSDMPIDEIQRKIAQIDAQRDNLQKRITSLENAKTAPDRATAQKRIETFDDILANGTFDEIRAVLFELIDRIEIDGDTVTIRWKFDA